MSLKIVQYVIVRKDLLDTLRWPFGAVIAQACHACIAITQICKDDEHTKLYLEDLDNMHKVILQADNETTLRNLALLLKENNILHKVWTEQPENYPTCIALKPYPKDDVQQFVKKFKLFK
ncbi:putative peptidyl-tRNA hydrolase PTRHD1 [Hydra vulgaris]|uniref:peptidyl-tRNA hydrolase n=1 Tax=Hydra vulgaris TaxID=6087 RepID=T2MC58_HYDVU|nr:putative peptidyl-tRNA hydrolase PTRHD1 [Hydra vulgaris]